MSEDDKNNKKKNSQNSILKKYNFKWIILVSIITFSIAIMVSLVSVGILESIEISIAFIILILIVILGVFFDTIGIAVAASKEEPFHAMAANRVKEAKYAIRLVRNAGPVSNFCNDVIGDISGIVSGAAGTIIVTKLASKYGIINTVYISAAMSAFVAALTVGGKALGKEIAISKNETIIYYTSKVVYFLDKKLKIDVLPSLKKRKNKRKRDAKSGKNSSKNK
ncbi:hypothetical protein [Dethiothermospora halolimnae]|uniref:hypothetical protein n=1 Tax=Dethiothermospora halolimnae TaxID=3114390 RepID=UPI003CCBE1FB